MLIADIIVLNITEWLENKFQSQIRKGKANLEHLTGPWGKVLHKFINPLSIYLCLNEIIP